MSVSTMAMPAPHHQTPQQLARASRRQSLPARHPANLGYAAPPRYDDQDLPPMPSAGGLPVYRRHDKPGGETRQVKFDRTRDWVTGGSTSEAPQPSSLQAFGYMNDVGGALPSYDNGSPTAPGFPAPDHVGFMGRGLERSSSGDSKTKKSAGSAAKSVLRLLGKKSDNSDLAGSSYLQLHD